MIKRKELLSIVIKRCVVLTLLVAGMLSAVGHANAYETELRTLATRLVSSLDASGLKSGTVLDFTDLQGQGTELGRFLAQELSDQLVTSAKTITFVDRVNLQHLLRETKMTMDGLVNPQTSRKLGNMVGVDTVVYGTVTPIGRSMRISVRAVAVETGKIVASQSAALPATGELGELYSRTVAPSIDLSGAPSVAPDLRSRFRADSIRITARQAVIGRMGASVNFTIENKSGMNIAVGIMQNTTTLGPCPIQTLNGINDFSQDQMEQIKRRPEPQKFFQYLPANGKITAAAVFDAMFCPMGQFQTAELSASVIIAVESEVFVFPVSVSDVRIVGDSGVR